MFVCKKSRYCIYKLLIYRFATGYVAPLIYRKQAVRETCNQMWDPPYCLVMLCFVAVVKYLLSQLKLPLFTRHTCWRAESCQTVSHCMWSDRGLRTSFFFSLSLFLPLTLLSIHQLPNFRTNTVESHKTLFDGSFQADAQTRTNAWIHGDPKMQMKHGPDTFHRGTSCHETAVMLLHTQVGASYNSSGSCHKSNLDLPRR